MRTTVDIDDRVLERAKRVATGTGQTLGALVSTALGAYLAARAPRKDEPFELIVRGRPGGRSPSTEEIAGAEQDDDMASLGMARPSSRAAR